MEGCSQIDISTTATGRTFYEIPEPVMIATVVDRNNCVIEWNHVDNNLEVLQYKVRLIIDTANTK